MIRHTLLGFTMALCTAIASQVHAIDLFWMGGGPFDLASNNYADNGSVNTGLTPTPGVGAGDVLFIGNGGTATFSGTAGYGKLRVGHNAATLPGQGTLTVSGGGTLQLLTGASGAANAGIWVGNLQNGVLNIDNATVEVSRLVLVGYGNNINRTGHLNVTNGGILNVLLGDLNLGERQTGGPANPHTGGVQGHVMVDDENSQINVAGHLQIGIRTAQGTYTQLDGTTSVGGEIRVGQRNADNSSLTVSGGLLENNGTLLVGYGVAETNGGQVNSGSSATFDGTAVVNTGGNITVGNDDAQNASLTIGGDAHVTTPHNDPPSGAGNVFIARGRAQNTTFTMTGGQLDVGNRFLMGSVPGGVIDAGGSATNTVGTQSSGIINTVSDFTLADTNGDSTYNLSGDGQINVGAYLIVGRQRKLGTMNQSSGSITVGDGVYVGNAFNADTAVWGSGVYNISGGSLTANVVIANETDATTALSIATNGTGTFNVIGDGAAIDINGDMLVNAGGGAQGTLAYQLEVGESLSMIDVSGIATFKAGSILSLDTSLASPTAASYDVLTAAEIDDLGMAFSGPAGWGFEIVTGGNGEILRLVQGSVPDLPGDHNSDGKVDAADYVIWRKTNVGGAQGYADFVQNFGRSLAGSGSDQGITSQVPEPAAGMLVFVGLATFAGVRSTRSTRRLQN